eukprot:8804024-Pyramimonas_sp.AAC.1
MAVRFVCSLGALHELHADLDGPELRQHVIVVVVYPAHVPRVAGQHVVQHRAQEQAAGAEAQED